MKTTFSPLLFLIAKVLFLTNIFDSNAETIQKVKVTNIDIVNCGEIENSPSIAFQEEKETIHGHLFVMDSLETPSFKPGCPKIVAKIGTQFGIQVQVNGSPDSAIANLRTRVTHPLMRNPKTEEEGTQDEWDSPMNIGYARYAGWQFEEDWELLPGAWKIEILHKDKVLASQEFTVEIAAEDLNSEAD